MLAAKHRVEMTLDEILLKELSNGPGTVLEIAARLEMREIPARLERRIRTRLDRLRVRGLVVREWKVGHRQYIFKLRSTERVEHAWRL
jgi:hypothetical protein